MTLISVGVFSDKSFRTTWMFFSHCIIVLIVYLLLLTVLLPIHNTWRLIKRQRLRWILTHLYFMDGVWLAVKLHLYMQGEQYNVMTYGTQQHLSESKSSLSASDDDLVHKKGVTSIEWKWFGYKRSDLQQSTIFSKICKQTVTAKGGNTTNLFHHLKQKHTFE